MNERVKDWPGWAKMGKRAKVVHVERRTMQYSGGDDKKVEHSSRAEMVKGRRQLSGG